MPKNRSIDIDTEEDCAARCYATETVAEEVMKTNLVFLSSLPANCLG